MRDTAKLPADTAGSWDEQKRQVELRRDLLMHRDKHLSQFMEINGKASLAVLAAIFGVFAAAGKVGSLEMHFGFRIAVILITGLGIVLLSRAAYILSDFHTRRIRSIQRRLQSGRLAEDPEDFEIIPPTAEANTHTMVGLLSLVAAALITFFFATSPDKPTEVRSADRQETASIPAPASDPPKPEPRAAPEPPVNPDPPAAGQ